MDNFANIGKAVILQSLGLQKNYSEVSQTSVEVNDYDTTACSSCKYRSIAKSFSPDSDAYKNAVAVCSTCSHHITKTETTYTKVYHNEKNRYGYRPMLKSVSVKMLLLFHFFHPDRFGVISSISFNECADILGCTVRTIHNNLTVLSDYGYISYSKNDSKHFSVILNDYENYYLPASQGGRGYIVMSCELFKQIAGIDNLISLRIHLRELVELDTLNIKGPFTAINKSFSEMKRSLPAYCKPCVIRAGIKDGAGIFSVTYKDTSVRFEILDKFDCKKQKDELYHTYISMLSDFISGFNRSVGSVNTGGSIPPEFSHFYDLSDLGFPTDMTGSYCMLHVSELDIEDMAQMALQYSYECVTVALSAIYKDYILKEKTIGSLGALIRTIIAADIQRRHSLKSYDNRAA